MSNPQRYNITAEMMHDAPEPFATLETNEAPDGEWVRAADVEALRAKLDYANRERDALTRERNTFQKRLSLANRALADVSHLIADIDHPKARVARIGIINTLQSTDLVNPNL